MNVSNAMLSSLSGWDNVLLVRVGNSLVETAVTSSKGKSNRSKTPVKIQRYSEIDTSKKSFSRLEVGSSELAQVLGGGLVRGSMNLIAGEPGIGKSTLLSQLTLYFASKHGKVLYVCGEESVEQVKLRLERLSGHKKTSPKAKDNVLLLPETSTDAVVATMEVEKPILTIIDSVQTMTCEELTGMAGSVGQVRESGNRIMNVAKRFSLSTFVVGHVTKSGSVAGPKVLEHMVDAVLNLSGERSGHLRLLRALKNRFGAVDEVGVFEMRDTGLVDVLNPSSVFLEEMQTGTPGSAVTILMEGTRPLLGEIQALVVDSALPTPRRVAEGVKLSRMNVICAVLQKHCRIGLGDKDVFVNVAGGMKAHEPAVDLAIALAIVSSVKGKALPETVAVLGEVGLLGEIRKVSFMEKRKKEAKKMGYSRLLSAVDEKSLVKLVKKVIG